MSVSAKRKPRRGKRVAKTYAEKRRAYSEYSRAQDSSRQRTGAAHGKREAPDPKRDRRRLWQLAVSAAILITVIAIKLAAPQTLEQYRQTMLSLIGDDTDFVAVFSEVGKAVGAEGGIVEALNDAYVAVFGTSEIDSQNGDGTSAEQTAVYSADTMPDNVCMTQQPLGFDYCVPVAGTLTDSFGYRAHPIDGGTKFHYGLDIDAKSGDVICSFADGTVTAVGESSDLGKYLTVLHDNDYTTLYAHCSRITASSGQQVKMGDPIAEVGDTGQTTGPHLHFELHCNTTYLNPIYYVSV